MLWKSLAGLALILPAPALADVKAGVDAWSRGDYAGAIREWQGPAERGDADALFNLGQAHKLGRGVNADLGRAEQLFGQAAAKGHLRASDLYGLLLFQRGERAAAIPYVIAAAERGEPRAQYLLGVASFNGDAVPRDWVKAYALTSLALQGEVEQAKAALAQMDRYIPLAQRQQAAALAPELASRAEATRARQLAAVDLGSTVPDKASAPVPRPAPAAPALAARRPESTRDTAELASRVARIVADDTPRTAGADFARPQVAPRSAAPAAAPVEAPRPAPLAAAAPQATPARPAPARPSGRYSVQLGAFSVAGNAEGLWNKVKNRAELAGTSHKLVASGPVTRLLATGYVSRAAAQAACDRLSAAGIGCLVPRN